MPTNYNFQNKIDYLKLKFPNISSSAQRLFLFGTQTAMSPGPNQVNVRFATISVVALNSANLSPGKENQALRITPTGTNEFWQVCTLNTGVTPRQDTFDFVGPSTRTYRLRFSYRGNASSIGREFYTTIGQKPFGGAGGLAAVKRSVLISDTNWNIFENTENLTFTNEFPMLGFGGFAAEGQPIPNYNWTPSDYVEIADFSLTWDEQPTTTTSFDDQFIPADTFRQGNLYGWGSNNFQAQGIFTSGIGIPYDGNLNKSSPILVNSYSQWKSLNTGSAGSQRYAIDSNGYLWFWGLSNFTPVAWPIRSSADLRTIFSTPALSSSNEKWIKVSRYGDTIEGGGLSIRTDGTLWTWGLNSFGQLGNNTTINSATLIQEFTSGTNWKMVAGGRYHVAAIKTDGTLWVWGRNAYGQLGINDNLTRSTPVQEFTSSTNWKQVGCTQYWTIAIKTDGTMWKWGGQNLNRNYYSGENPFVSRSTPTREHLLRTDWKSLYCSYSFGLGNDNAVALTNSGVAYRFGLVPSSNSGAGPSVSIEVFAQESNRVWKTASVVSGSYFLIDSASNLWAMGVNEVGSLGINDTIFRPTPVQVTQSNGWKEVTSGRFSGNINHGIRYIDPII